METLLELIAQGEHLHQDFKFSIDSQRKIARTLCAFANTEGGRLLIGIRDNRKVAGCNPSEELHMIQEASKTLCQPQIPFTSKIWEHEMKLVLEIDIAESTSKPHKAKDDEGNWKPYIRIKDHTTAVNKILERVWAEEKRTPKRPDKLNTDEEEVLKLIKENQPVTISQLYKKSQIQKSKIDKIVVFLVVWSYVEIMFETEGYFYRLREN